MHSPPTIQIFLKAPRQGLVKTRLAKTIGEAAALEVYRRLVDHQLNNLPQDWPIELHYAPADAEPEFAVWMRSGIRLFAQPEGDLGQRLTAAVESGFQRGAASIICIGADCPGLRIAHFIEAEKHLNQGTDLVIAPAEDGGYVLMGLRQPTVEVFQNIPWSSSNTLKATLDVTERQQLNVYLMPHLYDIDTDSDLKRALAEGLLEWNNKPQNQSATQKPF